MTKQLMSNEDYHASTAIGSSSLKTISSKTVLHYMSQEFRKTDAMVLGSAVHASILEPETFLNEFAVGLVDDGKFLRTADDLKKHLKANELKVTGKKDDLIQRLVEHNEDYKEMIWDLAVEAHDKANEGKEILKPETIERVNDIKESILSHEIAMQMLTGGEAEFSYFVTDKETGIEKKCRPDYMNNNSLIDLKTCVDASIKGFTRSVVQFGYHIQAAYYLDVYNEANNTNFKDFYFIAVETVAPYAIGIYKMDEHAIEEGRGLYKKALKDLKFYRDSIKAGNLNPHTFSYGNEIKNLELPQYAYTGA